MQQPAGMLRNMDDAYWYYSVWKSRQAVKAGELAQWKIDHPDYDQAVIYIKELRKNAPRTP